ncbi:MAG: hypothetical protein IIY55_05260 [Blautia sp.]|nr:hypothetical protein [Blautia sp.]
MVLLLLFFKKIVVSEAGSSGFSGRGTAESPYLIKSAEDLSGFRDAVNDGNAFEGEYFLQTENIDLGGIEWLPIGIYKSDKYFCGTYDGGGHYLENLVISSAYPYSPSNVGFFGTLSGTVRNLGIESGSIEGSCCGAIACQSRNAAMILNCYNKASVTGWECAGGIVNEFDSGYILNCVNTGTVTAPSSGGEIISGSAAYMAAVYPDEPLPETFSGEYRKVELTGDSVEELLNSGLAELLKAGVVKRNEVSVWR